MTGEESDSHGTRSPGGFGDVRLSRVGGALLAAMQSKRAMCVHALGHSRSEARQFQRFLDNGAGSIHEMLVHSARQTGCRAAGRHVLAICDTSVMNYAAHTGRKRGFAMEQNPDIGFSSYDRFFPSQDNVPAGGLGNLIALLLQHSPRSSGNSLFVDANFEPLADQ